MAAYLLGGSQPALSMSCTEAARAFIQKSTNVADPNEKKVYAIHLTDFYPSHGFIKAVTKNRGRFSATLHFSLGEPVIDHHWGHWTKRSYAVVTPLSSLRPQLLNLFPQDTFILGDFKIPKEAVVFLPFGEEVPEDATFKIIQYDGALGIKEAVNNFLDEQGSIRFKAERFPSNIVLVDGTDILEKGKLQTFFPKLFQDIPYLTTTSHDYTIWGEIDYTVIDYLASWIGQKGISKELNTDINRTIYYLEDRIAEINRQVAHMDLPPHALKSFHENLKELQSYLNLLKVENHLRRKGRSLLSLDTRHDPELFSKILSAKDNKNKLLNLVLSIEQTLPEAPPYSISVPRDYLFNLKYLNMDTFKKILLENFSIDDQEVKAVLARKSFLHLLSNKISAKVALTYFIENANSLTNSDIIDMSEVLWALAGNEIAKEKYPTLPKQMLSFLKEPWVHEFFTRRKCFEHFSDKMMNDYLNALKML